MKNKNLVIGIIVIGVIALAFILPNLGQFAIFKNTMVFPSSNSYGGTNAAPQTAVKNILCTSVANDYVNLINQGLDPNFCKGTYGYFDYGTDLDYACSGSSCFFSRLYFDLYSKDATLSNGFYTVKDSVNLDYYSSGTNNKVYVSLSPITCTSSGCSGNSVSPGKTHPGLAVYKIDLSSQAGLPVPEIYVATFANSGSSYGWSVVKIDTSIKVASAITCIAADGNCDGTISFQELSSYASTWISGSITFQDLINAANKWVAQ